MAIDWNNVAAPNLGESNSLFAQAIQSLKDAGAGLKDTAKDYQTVVRNRSHAILQDYINSAKTPEELQSEAFNTGFKNLQATLANEYDAVKVNEYRDTRGDVLTKRAGDAVALKRNEFGLGQDQLTAKKAQNAAELYTLRDKPLELEAAIQRQTAEGALDINAAQSIPLNVLNLKNATIDNRVKRESADSVIASALLDPKVKEQNIASSKEQTAVSWYNAKTQRAQMEAAAAKAEAERKAKQNEKNPALLLLSGIDKIDKTYNSEKLKPDNNPNAANTLTDWWNKQNSIFLSDTDLDNIKNTIETDPKLSKLSGKEKVFLAETSFQAIKNENTAGRNILATDGNREQAAEVVKRVYSDISTRENDYLYSQKIPLYRDAVRQQMIQTGTRDPVEAARNVGMNEYEMYRTNIRTPLQSMAESLYESSGSKLPKEQFVDKFIYRSVNKEPVDDLIKPTDVAPEADYSNVYRPSPGRGAGGIKQKSLGVLPPTTGNTIADPSQEPSALAAQGQRMNNRARLNLEAQKALRNGQPFVVPALTAKPEETKPRELTPAEKRQAERMQAASLERLRAAGVQIPKDVTAVAKEVKQSVFTDTPLKVLANAVKPVPSPLVPVESQNAFKSRDNNLSINLSTGKSVPSKDPVPMPKVSWGKPAEVVTMNPMVAKLPQYKAVATFVGDGDTFKATSKQYATKGTKANGNVLCRVDSVDAPETPHPPYKKGQPYGEEAGKKLQQMILNKEISIRIVKPANGDPNEPGLYGRDICQIEVEGANVSTELIRAGAAWLYREYNNYFTGLETVEANAKAEGRGLFSNSNAVYPQTAKHSGSLNLR